MKKECFVLYSHSKVQKVIVTFVDVQDINQDKKEWYSKSLTFFFSPWCSMNNTNEEVTKWEIGQGEELFPEKMRPLTCQERVESHLLPFTSVVGLLSSFPINIWYSLCQSETLFPSNDRCVFNVMSAFIVGGQMTVTLARWRRANCWSDSVS